MDAELIRRELDHFFGSSQMYKCHQTNALYTEGIKYLADRCKAWWLVSDVLNQAISFTDEGFVLIRLKKDSEGLGCTITYQNGDGVTLKITKVPYTDFPLEDIRLYFVHNTLLLPTEY